MAAAARLLRSAGITSLVATPTAAQVLASALDTSVPLAQVVMIGERAPPAVRECLAAAFDVAPVGLYAASECIIGPEAEPDLYRWDPARLHLEVETDGGIRAEGTGALLVTARHGEAQPLVRYRLGDRVVLAPPTDAGRTDGRVRFLGRIGHAFSLATGVRVGRAQVEAAVSAVSGLGDVEITVTHHADGRDDVRVVAHGASPDAAPALADALRASSIDLADALGGGFVSLNVECHATARTVTKRRLTFREQPWTL
jgi:phenylacetate-coenzyme A ligase PaaK-like adenylate-forming protein